MSRRDLHLLLEKYLRNQCSAEEKLIIEKLYGMLDKTDLEEIYPDEFGTIEQKLWDRINHQVSLEEEIVSNEPDKHITVKKSSKLKRNIWLAAASISITALISGYLFSAGLKNPRYLEFQSARGIIEKNNNTIVPMTINLEDGSVVVLQPQSSLFYPQHFSLSVREVSLKGEGFFQISKNPKRPFFVYNKNVITRVVGTSFIIKTNDITNLAEITVRTGKVMVCLNEDKNLNIKHLFDKEQKVLLTPNQKTTYSPAKDRLETSLVADPVLVAAKDTRHTPKLISSYEDTPVEEVINHLAKAYGIEITIQNSALGRNTFTGDISAQNLYQQLKMICHTIKAEYEISGTTIIIKPKTGL